jgi:hypothetical protein
VAALSGAGYLLASLAIAPSAFSFSIVFAPAAAARPNPGAGFWRRRCCSRAANPAVRQQQKITSANLLGSGLTLARAALVVAR